jgi:hypothetical protein
MKKVPYRSPSAAVPALALALMLAMAVFLSACQNASPQGSGANDGGSTVVKAGDPAYAQTYPEAPSADNPKGTEIYSIDEGFVKTQVRNNVMSYIEVTGGDRDKLLAAVATLKSSSNVDLLKAIAELTSCSIQTPGDGGTWNVNLLMVDATADDYKKLVASYKTLAGASVVFESSSSIVIDYSWGRLNTCRFSDDLKMIQVSFAFSAAK